MIELPYIYALIKYDILKWEFHLDGAKKKHDEVRHSGCLSGLISHLVRLAQFKHHNEEKKNDITWFAGYLGAGDCRALEQLVPVEPCIEFKKTKTKDEKVKDGSVKKTPVGDDKSKGQNEGGESSSSDSSESEEKEGGEEIKSRKSKKSKKSSMSKTSRSAEKSETTLYDGGSAKKTEQTKA